MAPAAAQPAAFDKVGTITAQQNMQLYAAQQLAYMQRQQAQFARYQMQAAAANRQVPFGQAPMAGQQDMSAVIAQRKRNPPQRWRHKSYDVGQHMRAEEQAKRRQRLASGPSEEPSSKSKMIRQHSTGRSTIRQHPQGGVPGHPLKRAFPKSAQSTPIRQFVVPTNVPPTADGQQQRLNMAEPAAAETAEISSDLIKLVHNARNVRRSDRRKRRQDRRAARKASEAARNTAWTSRPVASRSVSDLASLASKEEPTRNNPPYSSPQRTASETISGRGRSNTCPDVSNTVPPMSMLGTSATHSPKKSPSSNGVPPPQPRRVSRHYSQPISTVPGYQGTGVVPNSSWRLKRSRMYGSSSAHSSPTSIPRAQFPPSQAPPQPHPQPPTQATGGYPPPPPPPPLQQQQMDYGQHGYGQYMHQYISVRGQEHINELGQAARQLRTWQTPQTRYF